MNSTEDLGVIGEARISDFSCGFCSDTGILNGTAELDGVKVLILKPCPFCDVAKEARETEIEKHKGK